ncbi:MAG: ABC transporter permease, partial [Proteobacteria bacterium]|nr:ABC transporter permease [Pseudomonadota bacterium]
MIENSTPVETVEPVTQHRSLWGDVWRQFRKHKGAMTGVIVFIFITLLVSIGPLIHDIEPSAINFRERNLGPTLAHPLGTDNIGHDTLAQMLAGGQVSLAVGFLA